MYYIDTSTGIKVMPIQKLGNMFNQVRPFHQPSWTKETEY